MYPLSNPVFYRRGTVVTREYTEVLTLTASE
jgi:hypothetical protein